MSKSPIPVTAGFLPLTDSLLLVVAHEKGFALTEGLALRLVRETSWANIRDRVGVGHFDVAHMIAPLPIAANLGLAPLPFRFIGAMTLGHGGNAITVSNTVWEAMARHGAPGDLEPGAAGKALAEVVRETPRPLRFGVVHQNSSHNYELRYWLAASGIVPDRDIEIVVLPPPLLPEALAEGAVDGYCVGEPWNSVGVDFGGGRIVTTKQGIWRDSADKVLGMRESWAEEHSETLAALIRALDQAAAWCADPVNLPACAELLARPDYLDRDAGLLARALTGNLVTGPRMARRVPGFFMPNENRPNPHDARWYYAQMLRWGETADRPGAAEIAAGTFRTDLYDAALGIDAPLPAAISGRLFDQKSK